MNLKRLAEISPVIGSFLIFLGYLKLYIYYNNWNINISSYLDFSEILLSFLNDSNTILSFIIILIIQMGLGVTVLNSIGEKTRNKLDGIIYKNKSSEQTIGAGVEEIIPRFEENLSQNYKGFLLLLGIITIASLSLFLIFYNLIFLYISFFASIQLFIIIIDKVLRIKNEKFQLQGSTVIVLLGFTYCLSLYDIKKTETNPQRTTIYTEKDTISTNDEFIFIGKNNNFYFCFDKNKNQSIIIKDSEVYKSILSN